MSTFQLFTASLHQVMRSTGYVVLFISQRSAVINWCISILYCSIVPATSRSLSSLLLNRFLVVVLLDCGQPRVMNFNSAIPVDVVSVKYVLCG